MKELEIAKQYESSFVKPNEKSLAILSRNKSADGLNASRSADPVHQRLYKNKHNNRVSSHSDLHGYGRKDSITRANLAE